MAHFWNELETMQIHINKDSYECQICDNIFTSPIQLTVHCILAHALQPCVHCLKLFTTKQLLNDHTQIIHANDEHICSDCSDQFASEENCLEHILKNHSKTLCIFCGLFIKNAKLQQHYSMLHKVNSSTMQLFNQYDSQNEFHCELCNHNKSMDRLDKLFSHYLYFHKCSLQSLIRCILNDNTIESIQSAFYIDDGHSKCADCDFAYTWSVPKVYHKIYCQSFIHCMNCFNYFRNQEMYDKHLKKCQIELPKIAFCHDCSNDFDNRLHLISVHKISLSQNTWSQATSLMNAENHCNFCATNLDTEATNLSELINHFRSVHKFAAAAILRYLKPGQIKRKKTEKIEQNDDNNGTNKSVAEIRTFDADTNAGYSMNFDAHAVKYVYSSASDFDSSDSDVDTLQRNKSQSYQCDFCDFRTKLKFVHVMHMHKKHGFHIKTPEFRCSVCRKRFASNRSLKIHNQHAHHKQTTEKRFGCPFCEFCCNGKKKMR